MYDSYDNLAKSTNAVNILSNALTIRQQLEREIAEISRVLANKKAMLELLDANPVIEKFMNLQRGF